MNEMAPYGWEDDGAKTTPWHLFVALAKLAGIVLFMVALWDAKTLVHLVEVRASLQEAGRDVSKMLSLTVHYFRIGLTLVFALVFTFGTGWLTSVLNLQPGRSERRPTPSDLFVVVGKLGGLVLILQELRSRLWAPTSRFQSGLYVSLLLTQLLLLALVIFFTDPLARGLGLTGTEATAEQRIAWFRGGLILIALYVFISSLPGVVAGLMFAGFSDNSTLRGIFLVALAGWALLRSEQIARWVDLGPKEPSATLETAGD